MMLKVNKKILIIKNILYYFKIYKKNLFLQQNLSKPIIWLNQFSNISYFTYKNVIINYLQIYYLYKSILLYISLINFYKKSI